MVSADDQKKNAASSAVTKYLVGDSAVGLGTGSTAKHAVDFVADFIAEKNITVTAVCTSEATEHHAIQRGIVTRPLWAIPELKFAVDGADEIVPGSLVALKGAGGALLREKLVEYQAEQLVIIADESKLVKTLGMKAKLPVEVVKFGWELTLKRIQKAFPWVKVDRRDVYHRNVPHAPFATDEGHYLLDVDFSEYGITDPENVASVLKSIPGVVDHGLFINMVSECHIGKEDGTVEVLARQK
eukprot:NODE_1445_length_858_cov_87.309166_g1398_i0.p1 GENE.NODE_1445_length_858_cov_87.309166_g1398_i0~~NODE_1445_length_858_cov_87.309166_g1398_i0.p1  ORF type:complete len:242 (+),score=54.07 NODE_1445_length_858_cov_87.309166_g1398_i0:62-787(+)